jgi:uncharacterized protein (TIGR02266 family)
MTDREAEILRAEADAEYTEAEIAGEFDRAKAAAASARAQVEALKAATAQLQALPAGKADPQLAELSARLKAVAWPEPALQAERGQALEARAAAVAARAKLNSRLLAAAKAYSAAVAKPVGQLAKDAELLTSVERRVREAAKAAAAPSPAPAARPTKAETRRAARVSLEAAIDLTSDANFFSGFSSDLSAGGVFVATTRQVPIGTEVDLSFSLPAGVHISARGKVRWTRDLDDANPDIFPGMGVQFTELAATAVEAIRDFIQGREPLFFPD